MEVEGVVEVVPQEEVWLVDLHLLQHDVSETWIGVLGLDDGRRMNG